MSKTAVTLPLLSDTMETGRLTRWLKQPGDAVKNGDILAEVESDKAAMDVEAFNDGYLAGPLAPTDTDIPIKSTIAWIVDDPADAQTAQSPTATGSQGDRAEPATSATEGSAASSPTKESTSPQSPSEPTASTPPSSGGDGAEGPVAPAAAVVSTAARSLPEDKPGVRASTAHAPTEVVAAALASHEQDAGNATRFAQDLARELGIDLASIARAADQRISAAQVLAAAVAAPAPSLDFGPGYRLERPKTLKAAMAKNMSRSARTPTFHVTSTCNLAGLRAAAQSHQDSFTLLLARACAITIRAHPDFNTCWTPMGLARRDRVDIAVAADTPDGLITPVLRDATRSLKELEEDWRILKDKVERRRLMPADYSGGTFYLSNLGQFADVEQFDSVVPINASAVLAVAAPTTDGRTRLTLSCDHRVITGADAARFLETLAEHLEDVEALIT